MLKTYEVAIKNGQVIWLDEQPQVNSARALLTILEDANDTSINTSIHKDPFDRLIIASALEYGAKPASIDGLFPQYSELANCLLNS